MSTVSSAAGRAPLLTRTGTAPRIRTERVATSTDGERRSAMIRFGGPLFGVDMRDPDAVAEANKVMEEEQARGS